MSSTAHPFSSLGLARAALVLLAGWGSAGPVSAAITISGVSDRSRYVGAATFTIAGATSATLDGEPAPLDTPVTVTDVRYHELTATDGAETRTVRFIVKAAERGSSEDGLPPFTPRRMIEDAPSAFADGRLRLMAPPVYPADLPLPVVARLVKGEAFGDAAGTPLWLNGRVMLSSDDGAVIPLRRGWGSTILLPATEAPPDPILTATLHGQSASVPWQRETTTTWMPRSGTVSAAEDWGDDARIDLTATLLIADGATLRIGPGTVVRCAPGVEIWVRPGGRVECAGTVERPIVFVPPRTDTPWGGFWLQPQADGKIARLTATGTIFCRWGAARDWFAASLPAGEPSRSFSHHRDEGPLAAVAAGAVCELTDCALVGPVAVEELRGTGFASTNGTLALTRTLVQRATTGGQQNGGTVEIHESAVLEMTEPGAAIDSDTFFDEDNDGIYLVPGSGRTYRLTKTVIGWCRDDGIDTGASGSGETLVTDSWFENCTHEAISCSGANRRPEARGTVFFNSGQGMECGYGSGGAGPLSLLDGCALVANAVGARYGDNYGGGSWTYGGTMTVRNSLFLFNDFHDTWALDFTSWEPQNQRLVLTDSRLTSPADLAAQNGPEDSGNALWNPAAEAARLAPFMPVAGSEVGVDLLAPSRQAALADYPGVFQAALSTFSSQPVTVPWQVIGRLTPEASDDHLLAEGTLTFAPGETVQSWTAPLPAEPRFGFVGVRLGPPTHAAVTGPPVFYFDVPTPPAPRALFPLADGGWSYHAQRREPPADAEARSWTHPDYAATDWQPGKTAPIGCGTLGDSPPVVPGTILSSAEQGPSGDRTLAVYFRKEFLVDDLAAAAGLAVEFLLDDGAVFYLNGEEILRHNIDETTTTGGVVGYTTLAADGISGAEESLVTRRVLPAAALAHLRPGRNVLAVEVHQEDEDSSDLLLDVGLQALPAAPEDTRFGALVFAGVGYLYWHAPGHVLQRSPDLAAWSNRPAESGPLVLPAATAPAAFFRLAVP